MAACEICSRKIGGFGATPANPTVLASQKEKWPDIPENICDSCLVALLKKKKIEEGDSAPIEPIYYEDVESKIAHITTTTLPVIPEGYTQIGIVTSHVALGTGPISKNVSAVTDFFGKQSETYSKKMIEAECACHIKLKRNALEMGADGVVNVNITYTELTEGHGMLLVCMVGTAVKKDSQ